MASLRIEEAKAFVKKLNLKTGKEWQVYCQSGKKPKNIPGKPERVYAKTGWVNIGDFLGTGNIANQDRVYKTYDELKEFISPLGIKNKNEWFK